MLFVKVFLLIFSSLSLVQAGVLQSSPTTRPPALVWNSYNTTSRSYTFHFWLTNSTFVNNDVTEACPDVAIQSAFYLSNVKGMFADSKTNRLLIADRITNIVGEIFLGDFLLTNYRQLLKEEKTLGDVASYGQYDLDDLHEQLHRLAFTDDLAVDWITGNIYYPTLNQINVISSDLSFFINIKNVTDRIRAIAVNPVSRYLYYSTSGFVNFDDPILPRPSRVMRTDLAGYGERTLFSSPAINDVRSITVDYDDNRLYFVDVSSSGSRLLSTNLSDSSPSLGTVAQVANAVFEKVVVYERVVYVIGYSNQSNFLWVFSPDTSNRTVLLPAQPTSMALMVDFLAEYNNPSAFSWGSCNASRACDRICLPRVGTDRECQCMENEIRDEFGCNIPASDNGNNPGGGADASDGGVGTILFIVLIPIIAVIIVIIAIVIYRRYQQKKMVGSDSSKMTQPVLKQNSSDSDSKSDKAQTSQENGDAKSSKSDEEPQTSSANDDPQTSGEVNPSERMSASSHESREPRASHSSYRQRDPRYSRDYRYEDDLRYSRDYYRDGRYPRDYYGDPRASRGYYRDGYQRYSREYYGEEDPRVSRAYHRNDDPRVAGGSSDQGAAGPSRVKEIPSSKKAPGKTQPTRNENQSKLNKNSTKVEENRSRSKEGEQQLDDVPVQVHANNEPETAEVKV